MKVLQEKNRKSREKQSWTSEERHDRDNEVSGSEVGDTISMSLRRDRFFRVEVRNI